MDFEAACKVCKNAFPIIANELREDLKNRALSSAALEDFQSIVLTNKLLGKIEFMIANETMEVSDE